MAELWEQVLRFHHATRRPVTVAVALHADAAAACFTLVSLLRGALVQHQVHPIPSHQSLKRLVTAAAEDGEQDLFLLIGLGASLPLRELFDPSLHLVIVFDTQRPILLRNLRDEGTVDPNSPNGMPWLRIHKSEEARDEVDRFFAEAMRRNERKKRRRRGRAREPRVRRRRARRRLSTPPGSGDSGGASKKTPGDNGSDIDGDDSDQPSDDGGESGESRSISSSSSAGSAPSGSDSLDDLSGDDGSDAEEDVSASQAADWRDAAAVLSPHDEALYESTQCCPTSVASEMYELSILLNRAKDDYLWMAAVGVTDLLLLSRMDYAGYLVNMTKIGDHIALQSSARKRGDAVAVAHAPLAEGLLNGQPFSARLQVVDEPQLFLLRHWTLWDAIWHHRMTSALMKLHHADQGEQLLREMLARCGVSVRVAKQSWTEVGLDERKRALALLCDELSRLEVNATRRLVSEGVHDDLESLLGSSVDGMGGGAAGAAAANRRSLPRIPVVRHPNTVPSVTRTVGFGGGVSAFDIRHLFQARICNVVLPPSSFSSSSSSSSSAVAAAASSTEERQHTLEKLQRAAFWQAYDLLTLDVNAVAFQDAVACAKRLQSTVVTATAALLQRGVILSTRAVHYVLLNDPSRRAGAIDTFYAAPRLRYLAEHAAVALTVDRGRRWPQKPLLLCCPYPIVAGRDAYRVTMVHQGCVAGPHRALAAVRAWLDVVQTQSIEDRESIVVEPLESQSVVCLSKEVAMHLMERYYLQVAQMGRTLGAAAGGEL